MPLPEFTRDRVYGVLKYLNVRKACGPDGIHPRLLREWASELGPVLVQLYSLCLHTSTFPLYWRRALVQPIPKNGSRSDPSNYRPIAQPLFFLKFSKLFSTLTSWLPQVSFSSF